VTASEGEAHATLRFLTPTRLKAGGRLREDFRFRELAFAALRRMLELAHFHVPGERVDWEIRPYLEQASAVRVTATDLRWQDWQRYSNRQGRSMEMGGFVGTVEVAGDLVPFLPLLRSAEILHVGKGATFGLGRVAVETPLMG
jgi:CRISPR-associated endoribonuclease Cas6